MQDLSRVQIMNTNEKNTFCKATSLMFWFDVTSHTLQWPTSLPTRDLVLYDDIYPQGHAYSKLVMQQNITFQQH